MKVAMVRPPKIGDSVRGVGFYAERLFDALSKVRDLEISWIDVSRNPFFYQQFDIVHFPYFDFSNLTIPPIIISRMIVTVHDLIPLKFPENFPFGKRAKLVWPLQKKLLNRADAVITDSDASKNDILSFTGLMEKKVHRVYLAADPRFKKITDKEVLKRTAGKFHLPGDFALYVGGVNWNKNIISLIKACPNDLVLVGKEFSDREVYTKNIEMRPFKEVLRLIKKNKNIHVLGFVETNDLVNIYNLASVYVQPSIYEGFGLPVLEAMSCGTPVVSGRGGSLSEIGGTAVIYADTNNHLDLRKKIEMVLTMKKQRLEKLKEAGLRQSEKFSWNKAASETYEVYQEVLAGI